MPVLLSTILTLGYSEVELILGSIALIIMFGNWVVRKLRGTEQKETPPDATQRARAEEIAARRREQLRELARQRTGSPDNLSADEARQRAAAKSLYEKRAEALARARGETMAPAPSAPPAATPEKLPEAQVVRQPDFNPVEVEAERVQQQRLQERRRREQLERQMAIQRQQEEAARANREDQERAAHEALIKRQADDAKRKAAVVAETSTSNAGKRIRTTLSGPGVRDAFVLMEVLGKPKGLRSSEDE